MVTPAQRRRAVEHLKSLRVTDRRACRLVRRWFMDFVSDQSAKGRRFRVLYVVDDYSRECVLEIFYMSISGERVARAVGQLNRPLPKTIVTFYGPEFTSKAMFFRAKRA